MLALPDKDQPEEHKAGLMIKTLDIFEGGKKQSVNYHGMFDSAYFIRWMDKLIKALAAWDVHCATIVMDNAKYHKSLPEGTPKGSWKKQRMLEYCKEHDIAVNHSDLKSVIWDKLKKYINDHIKPIVVSMAEAPGHTVVFLTPHHSDLQPIKLVWSAIYNIHNI